jgi:hypothetical protein
MKLKVGLSIIASLTVKKVGGVYYIPAKKANLSSIAYALPGEISSIWDERIRISVWRTKNNKKESKPGTDYCQLKALAISQSAIFVR